VNPTRLGVIGSRGRMGTALGAYLESVEDVSLACTLDSDGDAAAFIGEGPDVVVDLSRGHVVDAVGPKVVRAGIPYIVGATGYRPETIELLTGLSDAADAPVLIVPNFSIGANLMIRFAALAARYMDAPVITERHHMGKADAPSGTALFTAQRIAAARHGATDLAASRSSTAEHFSEQVDGVLGGISAGIPVHSVRGDGYLAEQLVSLTLPGESLSIEHRSIDRRCFMPGIIYAIRNIKRVRGLQIGLDTILDI
jgi:4-hydroxy-tetrahydrodipicolinate reductase